MSTKSEIAIDALAVKNRETFTCPKVTGFWLDEDGRLCIEVTGTVRILQTPKSEDPRELMEAAVGRLVEYMAPDEEITAIYQVGFFDSCDGSPLTPTLRKVAEVQWKPEVTSCLK